MINLIRCHQDVCYISYPYFRIGFDDIQQFCEADEKELDNILSLVGMKKPAHIMRFKKSLGELKKSQGNQIYTDSQE